MSALYDLYENWVAAGEDWRKTKIFVKMTNSSGSIDSDSKGWLTFKELCDKMGDDAAAAMTKYLEAHKPEQCRDHPDAPGIEDSMQYAGCAT